MQYTRKVCYVVWDTDVYNLYLESDERRKYDNMRSFRWSNLNGIYGFRTHMVAYGLKTQRNLAKMMLQYLRPKGGEQLED